MNTVIFECNESDSTGQISNSSRSSCLLTRSCSGHQDPEPTPSSSCELHSCAVILGLQHFHGMGLAGAHLPQALCGQQGPVSL